MEEKENNQINTENISTDVNDQSRVFDDNGNRIVDTPTQMTENLTQFYENDQTMKSKNTMTKEQKTELIDETANKIKNSGILFFSNKPIADVADLTKRYKNASIFVVAMLIVCIVEFITYRGFFDILAIACFIYSIIVLRKININGLYAGLAGACCMILTFFILRIILGILLGVGLLQLLKHNKDFLNKINPPPVEPAVKQETQEPTIIENKPIEELNTNEVVNNNNVNNSETLNNNNTQN